MSRPNSTFDRVSLLEQPATSTRSWETIRDADVTRFGARGDGLGTTPADEGVDIQGEAWNRYPTPPFWTGVGTNTYDGYFDTVSGLNPFVQQRASDGVTEIPTADSKPFANTDTWDYIGIQRALWFPPLRDQSVVTIPPGLYLVNKTIHIIKGMECAIWGSGIGKTKISIKNPIGDFTTMFPNSTNPKTLLLIYKAGGQLSQISDMTLGGASDTAATGTGIMHVATNGWRHDTVYFGGFEFGVWGYSSDDWRFLNCTHEFSKCFLHSYECGSPEIRHCNLWQGSGGNYEFIALRTVAGAQGAGDAVISDSEIVSFASDVTGYELAVEVAGSLHMSNCQVYEGGSENFACDIVKCGAKSQILGNRFYHTKIAADDYENTSHITVGEGSTVADNVIEYEIEHAGIILDDNCICHDNTIIHANVTVPAGTDNNHAIYIPTGKSGCVVHDNYLSGGARADIEDVDSASIVRDNVQDGVLVSDDTVVDATTTISGATVASYYGKHVFCTNVAAVTVTLPANGARAGACVWFVRTADEGMTINAASANTLITFNDATASGVSFGAGQRVGATVKLISDGTYWTAVNESSNAMTVT